VDGAGDLTGDEAFLTLQAPGRTELAADGGGESDSRLERIHETSFASTPKRFCDFGVDPGHADVGPAVVVGVDDDDVRLAITSRWAIASACI
jgi:hypothetical protein